MNNTKLYNICFYAAVVCSLFSQIPELLDSGYDAYLKLAWALPFAASFLHFKDYFSKKLVPFYGVTAIFILYCALCNAVTGNSYIGADAINIGMSTVIATVSYIYWKRCGNDSNLHILALIVLVSTFLLSALTYYTSLRNSDIMATTYAYDNKNSMGQILLNGFIIGLILYRPNAKVWKVSKIMALLFVVLVLFLLRSRATLVGLFFIAAYFILRYGNKKVRFLLFVVAVGAVAFVLLNETYYDQIVNGILLGGREADNLDAISSGRLAKFELIMKTFTPADIWIGIGNLYFDCFPIIMVVQYGVLGAGIVFLFLLHIVRTVDARLDRKGLDLATFLAFWAMMLNSLFEAQSPFGPGIKCFLLWMLIGFSLAQLDKEPRPAKSLFQRLRAKE